MGFPEYFSDKQAVRLIDTTLLLFFYEVAEG